MNDLYTRAYLAANARMTEAMNKVDRYGGIPGEHHVRWLLDQMVRAWLGDGYDQWVYEFESWDPGVAP